MLMSSLSTWRRGFVRVKRVKRNEDGVAAVEFAMVSAPFFIFLFACFEAAMVFFSTATLDNAVADASRQILTGEVQRSGMSANAFKDVICDRSDLLLDCTKIKVDVRTFEDFGAITQQDVIDNNGDVNIVENFNPGQGGDSVLVSVYYEFEILLPNVTYSFSNIGNGNLLIASAIAFRNEPFDLGGGA